ncbi:MAG: hypothetical protein LQ351_005800 [Letrouitia transgressa]|nr:MAG: hypothetical protein LQ351_005800 [Letrouitia transgressa]
MSGRSSYLFLTKAIALFFCVLRISSATSSARKCYYPGGIYQPNDTPCNPTAPNSDCCAPEDICLSNGLCYRSNINRLHRGSCTDPTFKTPNCTKTCTGPNDSPYGWADVLECPDLQSWYCGVGNESRCQYGHSFKIADGYIADFRYQGGQGQQPPSSGVGTMVVTVTETVGGGIASCATGFGGGETTAYPYPTTSGAGGAGPSTAGSGDVITAGGTPFPPYPTASVGTGIVVPPPAGGNSSVIPASGGAGTGTPRPGAPGPSVQAFNPDNGAGGRRPWVVGSGVIAGVAAMMVWLYP